ncbi:uncharacterized protein LOC130680663 [Manis pentadactyla]|uniref:uncharacterized protein LOC130680663 n=1 Tax=Manis pentadactyla TaxID=143292 RepID=UPI00255CD241|nr:uncharacterized protein LOC130680663 [Manis pentadactyla]
MTSLYLLILLLSLETPTQGVLRWGILSAFPKPMPVRFNAAVFPRFFTTNSSINLPYLAKDTIIAPLGENRSFVTSGSLCFTTKNLTNCISLKQRKYGWFSDPITGLGPSGNLTSPQNVLWINGTFVESPEGITHASKETGGSTISAPPVPRQPKYAPHCLGDYEGERWPWTDCQSAAVTWADERHMFTVSPDMTEKRSWGTALVKDSNYSQPMNRNPFHKWMLCGVNGSCTDLSPLSALLGGGIGLRYNITYQCTIDSSSSAPTTTSCYPANSTQTEPPGSKYPPAPVCLSPPFLFILSNDSFNPCSNTSCFLSQCWDALNFTNALVARIPR